MITSSAVRSALKVSKPMDGGQSMMQNSYSSSMVLSTCSRRRSLSLDDASSCSRAASSMVLGAKSSCLVICHAMSAKAKDPSRPARSMSLMDLFSWFSGTASPNAQWACGSMSTSNVLRPWPAKTAARLIDTVVLPQPPFWLITAIVRNGLAFRP